MVSLAPRSANPWSLTRQVVLVTGAGSPHGIGRSIVLEAVRMGAKAVYAADLHNDNHADLVEQARKINSESIVESVVLDCGDGEATQKVLKDIIRDHGRLDAFFANAGYVGGRTLQEETEEFMTTSYRIMQLGPFSALQFGSQAMAVLSEEKKTIRGSIVVTGSIAGNSEGWADLAYTTSKHAAVGIVHAGAALLQDTEIRVNGVAPGAIATDIGETSKKTERGLVAEAANKGSASLMDINAMNQFFPGTNNNNAVGSPDEIARLAVFLASDAASAINGQMIVADKGGL